MLTEAELERAEQLLYDSHLTHEEREDDHGAKYWVLVDYQKDPFEQWIYHSYEELARFMLDMNEDEE